MINETDSISAKDKLDFYAQSARHYSSLRFVIVSLYATALAAISWSANEVAKRADVSERALVEQQAESILLASAVGVSILAFVVLIRAGVLVSRYSRLIDSVLGESKHPEGGWRESLELNNVTDYVFRLLTASLCAGGAVLTWVVVDRLITGS